MINLSSGGRSRLSGATSGVMMLLFILFLSETHRGKKTYRPHDTLFFASTANFTALFTPRPDPADVTIDCRHLRVADHSAIEHA